jgi:membrane fusion protein, type I secretion system
LAQAIERIAATCPATVPASLAQRFDSIQNRIWAMHDALLSTKNEALSIETKVQPQDIDQLRLGQPAVVRFTAFSQRTTPELNGTLSRISADVSEDQKSGTRYYTIRIAIPDSEIVRLGGLKLVPGMPVEAFIQTTPRTMISYLVRPIHDQVIRAFREK